MGPSLQNLKVLHVHILILEPGVNQLSHEIEVRDYAVVGTEEYAAPLGVVADLSKARCVPSPRRLETKRQFETLSASLSCGVVRKGIDSVASCSLGGVLRDRDVHSKKHALELATASHSMRAMAIREWMSATQECAPWRRAHPGAMGGVGCVLEVRAHGHRWYTSPRGAPRRQCLDPRDLLP